jgi:hypothetical protein
MIQKKVITGLLSGLFLVTESLVIYSLVTARLEMVGILSVTGIMLLALATRYAAAKR